MSDSWKMRFVLPLTTSERQFSVICCVDRMEHKTRIFLTLLPHIYAKTWGQGWLKPDSQCWYTQNQGKCSLSVFNVPVCDHTVPWTWLLAWALLLTGSWLEHHSSQRVHVSAERKALSSGLQHYGSKWCISLHTTHGGRFILFTHHWIDTPVSSWRNSNKLFAS